jgi:hypothetical protein
MAKYTSTQIKNHLASIRKDLLRETGTWNARYKRIFQEVDRLLSSIGNRDLSDKEIRDIFAMLHFKPPRKKNPKMSGRSIKRAIEKMGGYSGDSILENEKIYDPIIEGSDRRISLVDRDTRDDSLGYVHAPFAAKINQAVQSLMDDYERSGLLENFDDDDDLAANSIQYAREYGALYPSSLPESVAADIVSLQDNVLESAQMILEDIAKEEQDEKAEKLKQEEKHYQAAAKEMEDVLFNPSPSPRVKKKAREIDAVLASLGNATMLSQAEVNAILKTVGLSPEKMAKRKRR